MHGTMNTKKKKLSGIFHWCNHSGCTMTLKSNQPLTEMSISNISWGVKADGVWGW